MLIKCFIFVFVFVFSRTRLTRQKGAHCTLVKGWCPAALPAPPSEHGTGLESKWQRIMMPVALCSETIAI